ncbi:MAG: PEP/pyruvate-binding domain-containing protein [Gemmatimonadota bacterium]|nr:PEP/pyruvate-binding domain-containing protein [Gemmatimonadota bacterium]
MTPKSPRERTEGSLPLVVPLLEGKNAEIEELGGKAGGLRRLVEAEVRVPDGFVVTGAALTRFLDSVGLAPPEPDAPEDEVAAFRDRLRSAPLPEEVAEAVGRAHRERLRPDAPVAVRSSGSREDLEGSSFAGIYETRLNVRGIDAVLDAVRACWVSLWAPRVEAYARHRGDRSRRAMAVVVQEMVEARVSGVLFTVNPLDGREEEMLVEAVFGLGEGAVSGRVEADRFVVDAWEGAVLDRTVGRKELKVMPTEQGVEEVPLSAEEAGAPTLSDPELSELAEAGRRIQVHFGRPMDVEWAYGDQGLFILQARPVTGLSFSPDVGEWTTADFRDGGVSSDVCTPFMWSLYRETLSISLPGYLRRLRLLPEGHEATWGRMFFGRPYWNLGEVKKALSRIPGYDEAAFHADMGVEVDADFEATTTPTTFRGVLSALPTLVALNRLYRERLEANRAFVDAFEGRVEPYDLDDEALRALDDGSFLEKYRRLVREHYLDTETSYFLTIYNTSNAKQDLEKVLKRVGRARGEAVDAPALLSGLRDLSHLRPMKEMHGIVARSSPVGAPTSTRKPCAPSPGGGATAGAGSWTSGRHGGPRTWTTSAP